MLAQVAGKDCYSCQSILSRRYQELIKMLMPKNASNVSTRRISVSRAGLIVQLQVFSELWSERHMLRDIMASCEVDRPGNIILPDAGWWWIVA